MAVVSTEQHKVANDCRPLNTYVRTWKLQLDLGLRLGVRNSSFSTVIVPESSLYTKDKILTSVLLS